MIRNPNIDMITTKVIKHQDCQYKVMVLSAKHTYVLIMLFKSKSAFCRKTNQDGTTCALNSSFINWPIVTVHAFQRLFYYWIVKRFKMRPRMTFKVDIDIGGD